MDNIKWLGIFALAGGLCVLGYQGLEAVMSEGVKFVDYTPLSIFGEDAFEWIDSAPGLFVRNGLVYLINSPLYAILLVIGVVFLVFNGIFAKK